MTRKDYELIAEYINTSVNVLKRDIKYIHGAEHVIRAVAGALAKDNSRFDHDRFFTACTRQR